MNRIKVVVTGAAGQIGYSLIPRLVDGHTFGDKTVDLTMVEIPQVVDRLEGLVMELEDSYFPNLGEVKYTSNFEEAAKDGDWFLLVGSIPRGIVYEGKKIEERSDLLKINGGIFVEQGQAIGEFGNPNAKILVVGNPAKQIGWVSEFGHTLVFENSQATCPESLMEYELIDNNCRIKKS